jgi:hypothetical protein
VQANKHPLWQNIEKLTIPTAFWNSKLNDNKTKHQQYIPSAS